MPNKFIKEPLVHFLFAGFLLFVYFKSCSTDSGLENAILIQKSDLLNFMQYQSKAFNQEVFESKLDELPESEKEQMIQNYIQDEVLYREALKLGLDQNDFVIKRRIIQKMEFILNDFDETNIKIEEDSLKQYFEQNQQRYFQPAQFTFTHIFFKNDDKTEPLKRANDFMNKKQNQKLSTSESLKYGDRFLYHRNYAERTLDFLKGQFGSTFIDYLSKFEANENLWQGPIESEHGQHLIKLTHKSDGGNLQLSEIKNVVKSDYLTELKKRNKKTQIQKLINEYEVEINW